MDVTSKYKDCILCIIILNLYMIIYLPASSGITFAVRRFIYKITVPVG